MAVKVLTILSQFRARKNNDRTKLQLMRYKILKMLGNETKNIIIPARSVSAAQRYLIRAAKTCATHRIL